jgi:hypothetical protein
MAGMAGENLMTSKLCDYVADDINHARDTAQRLSKGCPDIGHVVSGCRPGRLSAWLAADLDELSQRLIQYGGEAATLVIQANYSGFDLLTARLQDETQLDQEQLERGLAGFPPVNPLPW